MKAGDRDPAPDPAGLDELVAAAGVRMTGRVVDLGVTRLDLRSNLPGFAGWDFFSRFAAGGADHRIDCVDLDAAALDEVRLAALADRSFRADRFATGFYLTYYFGPPAYLVTRGRRAWVFGRDLERTVWPYFVKHLLTAHAADTRTLHLKAAGLAGPDGRGTLLAGRGGAGKTVFLTSACAAGMAFLCNTHVMLAGTRATGVPSAVRVRDDPCFAQLVKQGLDPHLLRGEFRLDPATVFARSVATADVATIVVVDHRPDRPRGIRELPADRCYDFLEQFSFPVSAYGLKDDLLAHCDGDLDRYTEVYARMKAQLRALVESSRRLHVNTDMLDPVARDEALAALGPQ